MPSHDIPELVKQANSFPSFNPLQEAALKKGLLEKSAVVSSPTASGKTVLAELAGLQCILNEKRKVIYTCPLRALASEHYADLKSKYAKALSVRMAISTGDFDSSSSYLSKYDFIFCTNEKLDSLLRHGAEWLSRVGLLIVDEVHELDSDRGATLEIVVTRLRALNKGLRVLALSATIPNAQELAKWLNASLVQSTYRPIPLKEGVHFNQSVSFSDATFENMLSEDEPLEALVQNTLEKKKQALVFANTRKRAESLAQQMTLSVYPALSALEKKRLKTLSEKALHALELSTEQCERLSKALEKGTAFHHAGLVQRQRKLVEDAFRDGLVKMLSATPSLAMGVNLPAFRVIIPTLYRFGDYGAERISVREYKQCAGRAGRPKFDSAGEAIVLAKTEFEALELMDAYLKAVPEPVHSQLGRESALRGQVLALIAGNVIGDLDSMHAFFSKTFHAFQSKEEEEFFAHLNDLVLELIEMNFVEGNEKSFKATRIGRRVSELYLDPHSAHQIIHGLQRNPSTVKSQVYLAVNTTEFQPYFNVPKREEASKWAELEEHAGTLGLKLQTEMFSDPLLLQKFNSVQLLNDWMDEVTEQNLLKQYNVQPGILRQKLQITDWLCYACIELAKTIGTQALIPGFLKLRARLKNGIREELIVLCELRGIGRVRARRLWNANLRTLAGIKQVDYEDLSKVLGSKVAANVKRQLGQDVSKAKENGLTQQTLGSCRENPARF